MNQMVHKIDLTFSLIHSALVNILLIEDITFIAFLVKEL